jgi:transposase
MLVDRTNSENVIAFLRGFVEQYNGNIRDVCIITDNHSAHKSKATKAELARLNLDMRFLPPWSSVLNPIERVWSIVKGDWAKQLSKI